MKILIRKARIVDSNSPFNGHTKDILVENGRISQIDSKIDVAADKIIEIDGLHASPGWMDPFAHFNDPGFEFKETLETGAQAAAAGGYTHVFILPNTNPVIHGKSQVEYIKEKSRGLPVNIHPIGAVSKNAEGKELAEMYDMRTSGAIAFGDGLNSIQSAGVLLKALQYVRTFDGTVIQIPDDTSVGTYGLINEGIISTTLGLPGKPIVAEELMVARDIKLARYAESRLHFTAITSKKSLDYILRGKESGAKISCSVTPYHLFFSDEDLMQYDTDLKVNPPLRTSKEKNELLDAVKKGLVDCIATHHQPHEWDSKTCEFEHARNGMIGLESSFSVLRSLGVDTETWVKLSATNPRKIFGMPEVIIKEGSEADLTLFDPEKIYRFEKNNIKSKSKNSPFVGRELKGQVIGIINGEKLFTNQN
ncbi:MAG: dihydroorotase [Bacteroidetes bacterium]|nr:MAG: dihydroorotase [Bacteroidota bacterium]